MMIEPLPLDLPLFPLAGVLLLPRGNLPLNIFEPRYLAMVDDALKSHRMIGMIQPQGESDQLFQTGCAGKIIAFNETDDGRYEITLRGISRFHIAEEHSISPSGYRHIRPNWSAFFGDRAPGSDLNLNREKLCRLLQSYFDSHGMDCNWSAIDNASDDKLMTCLAMICPFDCGEKQALLEAACCKTRADLFMALLEMDTRNAAKDCSKTPLHH